MAVSSRIPARRPACRSREVGTFGGSITANLSIYKAANTTEILTNTSSYNGVTNIYGGTLALQDSGALTATTAINITGGATLQLNNTGLSDSNSRITASVPVTLMGGTLRIDARTGFNDTQTVNLSFGTGANTIAINPANNAGGYTINATGTASAIFALGATVNFTNANSGTVNFGGVSAAPKFFFSATPTTVNGIIGGWATVNGADFASYTAANGISIPGTNGAIGYTIAVTTSAALSGAATDNVTTTVALTAGTTRTLNTLSARNTAATAGLTAVTMNGLDQILTLNAGGLLVNMNGQTTSIQGGRLSAGSASNTIPNTTLYIFANNGTVNLQQQVMDNGYSPVSVVKSGSATVNFGVSPIVNQTAQTASTAGTLPGLATLTSTNGIVAGMIQNGAIGEISAGSIVTTVNSGTQYAVNTTVSGTSAAGNAAYLLPTSSVITNVTAGSFSGSTVTVPVGSVILPGSTVTLATGTGGATASLGTLTVIAYNSATGQVTLSGTPTVAPTATSTLLFSPIGASAVVASSAPAAGSVGSNVINLANANNSLMIGAAVTGTNVPAGATIVSISSPTSFTISAPVSVGAVSAVTVTTPSTAPTAQSLITSTTSGSNVAVVIGSGASPGLFIGQQITGPGIPYGTTVQGITPIAGSTTNFTVTLSQNASATAQANEFYSLGPVGSAIVATNIATGGAVTVASIKGLAVGMSVVGTGIPANTVIGSFTGTTQVNLINAANGSAAVTTASTTNTALNFSAPLQSQFVGSTGAIASSLSGTGTATVPTTTSLQLTSVTGLAVGMFVQGPGITNGTTITAINTGTNTLTLSTNVNATAGTASLPAANANYAFYLPSTFSENYAGTTYANQGTLAVGAGGSVTGSIQIPGNLVISNGATVTESTAGLIASTSNVTIIGSGTLTLTGSNTLGSIGFTNNGGVTAPTVTPTGTLLLTNPVVNATSDNAGSVATIGTGTLNFISAPTFNASTNTPERFATDLLVNSVITNTLGFGWQIAPNGTNFRSM